MATKRTDKLKRLVELQRKKEKIAETQLAEILNQQQVADHSVTAVVGAMGKLDPLHNTFSEHYTKRLINLDVQQKKLQLHRNAQEKAMMTEKVKADRLEEKVSSASFEDDMSAQDEELQDLLDVLGGWKNTSSR